MLSFKKITESLSANGLEMISSFGVMTAATALFPMEVVGQWLWLMAVLAVHTKIREGLTQSVLLRFGFNGELSDQLAYQKATLLITLSFEFVAAIIAMIVADFGSSSFQSLWIVYPVYSVATALFRWQQFYWQGSLQTKKQWQSQMLLTIAISFCLLLFFLFTIEISSFVLFLGICRIVGLLPFFSWSKLDCLFFASITKRHWSQLYHFSFHGLWREVVGSIAARSHLLFTTAFLSYSEIALIGLASRYAQLFALPNGTISGLVYAKACQTMDLESGQNLIARSIWGLWVLLGTGWAMMAVALPYAFPILHGNEFVAAVPVCLILVAQIALFSPIGTAFGSLSQLHLKPQLTSQLVTLNSLLTVGFVYAGSLFVGFWGAIAAFVPVEIFGLFFMDFLLKKYFQSGWISLLRNAFQGFKRQGIIHIKPSFLTST